MKELFCEIERVLPDGGAWCDLQKACTLAAMIVADRPPIVVEIGVWQGGSLVPMLLAMKHANYGGRAIAIDPWASSASVEGQIAEADRGWWGSVDHGAAHDKFLARLYRHDLRSLCEVVRMNSSEAPVPGSIGLLHIDGNHGEQAIADVARFAPSVNVGGVLVLDDLHWSGGAVERAYEAAQRMGFVEQYKLGTGCVMRRLFL
jgi:predicted O-methyltransferase YrrM